MITKQHTADLKDMVDILSDINKELDGSMHTCKLCGRDSWVDLQEGRLANEVAIMLRKTYKCISVVNDALKQQEEYDL
tara:strand:+ start:366 stop:599 length:234 start_codon:yes stop_codon:yes gene_type:complete